MDMLDDTCQLFPLMDIYFHFVPIPSSGTVVIPAEAFLYSFLSCIYVGAECWVI